MHTLYYQGILIQLNKKDYGSAKIMTNKDINMHYRYMCAFIGWTEYYNRLSQIISCKLDKPQFTVGEILND